MICCPLVVWSMNPTGEKFFFNVLLVKGKSSLKMRKDVRVMKKDKQEAKEVNFDV